MINNDKRFIEAMLKNILLIISILITLAFCVACNNSEQTNKNTLKPYDYSSETSSETRSYEAVYDDNKTLEKLLSLYETDRYFKNPIVLHKYLIIGPQKAVVVFLIDNNEFLTEIPKESISRIEKIPAGEYSTVMIHDKSGESINFLLTVEDAETVVMILNK